MSILRKLMMILPLALLFSVAGFAQTSQFEGNVKGADGKPVQGAEIRIERQDVKGNYKTKTDKKGHYFYGGLPLGNYKITVATDGQDRDAQQARSKLGDTTDISFDLAKAAANTGAAAAPPDESGRAESASDKAAREAKNKEQAAAMAKNKELNEAFGAGKTGAAAGNWDAAIDGFTKASTIDPNQHVVWGNLADALVSRSKSKTGAEKDGDLTKATEAYQKAIAIKPDDAAYHNNYGLVLGQQKKGDEAQAEITKAAQLDPPNAGKYYFNLGAVYVNGGNTDSAVAAFKKAIDTDPNYSEAYYQYGISLMGKATVDASGKPTAPAGTTEAFQKYLELAPNGPNAQVAKDMLTSLGSSVDTGFSKAPAKGAPAKKK